MPRKRPRKPGVVRSGCDVTAVRTGLLGFATDVDRSL